MEKDERKFLEKRAPSSQPETTPEQLILITVGVGAQGHLLPIIVESSEHNESDGRGLAEAGGAGGGGDVEEEEGACSALCRRSVPGPMELGLGGGSGGGAELRRRRCVACRATGGRAPDVRFHHDVHLA